MKTKIMNKHEIKFILKVNFGLLAILASNLATAESKTKLTEFVHSYETYAQSLTCEVSVDPSFIPDILHHSKTIKLNIAKIEYYYHPTIFNLETAKSVEFKNASSTTPIFNCTDIDSLKANAPEGKLKVDSVISTYLVEEYLQTLDECETSIREELVVKIEQGPELKASEQKSASRSAGQCLVSR